MLMIFNHHSKSPIHLGEREYDRAHSSMEEKVHFEWLRIAGTFKIMQWLNSKHWKLISMQKDNGRVEKLK